MSKPGSSGDIGRHYVLHHLWLLLQQLHLGQDMAGALNYPVENLQ